MDGIIANLKSICDLAEKYDALVMVDDSHAVGFMGKTGRGTHEYCDVMGRVDIITGTLGKALGGASGGYTSGPAEIITMLRQRSRPYLFSNSVAPPILGASLKAIEICTRSTELRDRLEDNTRYLPRGHDRAEVQHRAGRAPDHADHDRRRRAGRKDGRAVAGKRRLRDRVLLIRSCRRARPESACRSRPPTAARISTSPSMHSPRCATSWDCEYSPMLIAYVSDERYVALPDVLLEFEGDAGSFEARSRATGSVHARPARRASTRSRFRSPASAPRASACRLAPDREPYQLRLLADGLLGYAWPKWVKAGEKSEFRVHSVEPYHLSLWRYGIQQGAHPRDRLVRRARPAGHDADHARRRLHPDRRRVEQARLRQPATCTSTSTAPERSGLYYFHARTQVGR